MQFLKSERDEKNTALNYLGLLKTQMRSDGSELMPAVEVKFCRSPLEKKCFQAGKLLRIVFHFHNKIKTGLDVKINSYPCLLLLSIYFQIIEEVIIQLNRRFPSKPTSCINVTADDSLKRTQSHSQET